MNTSSNPADSKLPDNANLAIDATRDAVAIWKAKQVEECARKRALDDAVRNARADRKKAATAARQKDRKCKNQRDCRARKATAEAARIAALVPKRLCRDLLFREVSAFRQWLQMPGQRRTQLRKRSKHYWTARVVLLQFRLDQGRDPSGAEFARLLSRVENRAVDRYQGVYTLRKITTLEGGGGPWPAVTKNV